MVGRCGDTEMFYKYTCKYPRIIILFVAIKNRKQETCNRQIVTDKTACGNGVDEQYSMEISYVGCNEDCKETILVPCAQGRKRFYVTVSVLGIKLKTCCLSTTNRSF